MRSDPQPPFQVRLRSRRVQRELETLPQVDRRRVTAAIQALGNEPRPTGAVQLEDSFFRVRVGRYRIIYYVDTRDRIVDIGGIRRRTEETYRGIRDLF